MQHRRRGGKTCAARQEGSPRHPDRLLYEDLLRRALLEDLGGAGDLTTDAIVDESARARASFVARRAGRIAGLRVALDTLRLLDAPLDAEIAHGDGSDVEAGAVLARISGSARASHRRARALNLLGRPSGIATATRDRRGDEDRTAGASPTSQDDAGLRLLGKYAVRSAAAPATPPDDAILIRTTTWRRGWRAGRDRGREPRRATPPRSGQVDSLAQQALTLGTDLVLLTTSRSAISGGAPRAGRAVLRRQVGSPRRRRDRRHRRRSPLGRLLTHSAPALDVALDFEPADSGAMARAGSSLPAPARR